MSLLVTGTIGIDTVETPHGVARDVLGGSATYFAFAARLLAPVRLVGVVGEDFPEAFHDQLRVSGIDASGLETRKGSKTFQWHGRYFQDMNQRESLRTDLNVIAEAPPAIPERFRDSEFVFLANTHPDLQYGFLKQLSRPRFVVCDTMDMWINNARSDLHRLLKKVDGIVLNDAEARSLTGCQDLIAAGHGALELGPKFVVVKKGEHGLILFSGDEVFALPGFPTAAVRDPTGAGDSFAGGMMGYLAATGRTEPAAVKSSLAWGACTASITIEDFSLRALAAADRRTLDERMVKYRRVMAFD